MQKIEEMLQEFKTGGKSMREVLEYLEKLPFEDLCFAKVDHHRCLRRGFAEVIYGEGKTADQIAAIAESMMKFGSNILVTRVDKEKAEAIMALIGQMDYHSQARALTLKQEAAPGPVSEGTIHVICAGSSDMPVAEEAALTAEFMDNKVQRNYDVGVAGIHRLLSTWEELRKGSVYVVAAGMEGALPSVVAGLVKGPVIAVPTSVGYGASFGGIAPLLGMLNSCSPGVCVVNIDNGFGAGYLASVINRQFRGPEEP
ncbi:MAG: nickel pincer cofactor biosynthesis protein LarB [Syntrophobacteraceae bacterium]|jgi:NCAIR mutase (PurE)-related protein